MCIFNDHENSFRQPCMILRHQGKQTLSKQGWIGDVAHGIQRIEQALIELAAMRTTLKVDPSMVREVALYQRKPKE